MQERPCPPAGERCRGSIVVCPVMPGKGMILTWIAVDRSGWLLSKRDENPACVPTELPLQTLVRIVCPEEALEGGRFSQQLSWRRSPPSNFALMETIPSFLTLRSGKDLRGRSARLYKHDLDACQPKRRQHFIWSSGVGNQHVQVSGLTDSPPRHNAKFCMIH
jgi:hypothetical protein